MMPAGAYQEAGGMTDTQFVCLALIITIWGFMNFIMLVVWAARILKAIEKRP